MINLFMFIFTFGVVSLIVISYVLVLFFHFVLLMNRVVESFTHKTTFINALLITQTIWGCVAVLPTITCLAQLPMMLHLLSFEILLF